ncbi:biopolymer transporter ExbD [Candidimonas humi]|jgi:biopolymer transport protein ExbD|uniref:ExbD/TolR family protein n=1 Tax=Candidimonas humi TaxID=683355 RepID=A0ABV8NW06_9BURK|nr:biopolymer transporter ExbD [Candidimonas humi]MBV6305966.1 biopolymer transporter ExbD [Candidimonas humi]
MNFRPPQRGDEPEINLIPLIDVLLVILIFLTATTSFTRIKQLGIDLPQAQADAVDPKAINIAVSRDGQYALDGRWLQNADTAAVAAALAEAARGRKDPVLVINADAQSTHESVVRVMQAARLARIGRVDFATRDAP